MRPTSEGSTLLTEAERQIADLVVAGLTNSEVAGRLFMAQRTVESHLSKVYRKLGVNSRAHLTKVLSATCERSPEPILRDYGAMMNARRIGLY